MFERNTPNASVSCSESVSLTLRQRKIGCLFGGLCLLAISATAQAQLQIPCPVNWSALTSLEDPNLDFVLFGVKVRDWKPEYFNLVAARDDECMRQMRTVDSIRQASLNERPGYSQRFAERFQRRDKYLAQEQRLSDINASVAQTGQAGASIRVSPSGELLPIPVRQLVAQKAPVEWSCKTFGQIDPSNFENRMIWPDEPSLKTMTAYAKVCLQAKAITEAQGQTFMKFQQTLLALYAGLPNLAVRVDQLAAKGNAIKESDVVELIRVYNELAGGSISPGKDPGFNAYDFPLLKNVITKLAALEEAVAEKQCLANYARTQLPAKWQDALYLSSAQQASPFKYLVCRAVHFGVSVRPVNSSAIGVFGKEGVEFKGKQTVQVFVEMIEAQGNTKKEKILRPVMVKINGTESKNLREYEGILTQTIEGK